MCRPDEPTTNEFEFVIDRLDTATTENQTFFFGFVAVQVMEQRGRRNVF